MRCSTCCTARAPRPDEEGQPRGLDAELLDVAAEIPDEDLAAAGRRLQEWRRRYGNGPLLAERRSGAILARLQQRRRAVAERFGRPPRRPGDRPS